MPRVWLGDELRLTALRANPHERLAGAPDEVEPAVVAPRTPRAVGGIRYERDCRAAREGNHAQRPGEPGEERQSFPIRGEEGGQTGLAVGNPSGVEVVSVAQDQLAVGTVVREVGAVRRDGRHAGASERQPPLELHDEATHGCGRAGPRQAPDRERAEYEREHGHDPGHSAPPHGVSRDECADDRRCAWRRRDGRRMRDRLAERGCGAEPVGRQLLERREYGGLDMGWDRVTLR